jgi:hypothetical protein
MNRIRCYDSTPLIGHVWTWTSSPSWGSSLKEIMDHLIADGYYTAVIQVGHHGFHTQLPSIELEELNQLRDRIQRFPTSLLFRGPETLSILGDCNETKEVNELKEVNESTLLSRGLFNLDQWKSWTTTVSQFSSSSLIVHMGRTKLPLKLAKETICKRLVQLNLPSSIEWILENGGPKDLCQQFHVMYDLLDTIRCSVRAPRIRLGIHVAHFFVTGSYDISQLKGMHQMFHEYSEWFNAPPAYVWIEDTRHGFGSQIHTRVPLGAGKLFTDGTLLAHLMDICIGCNIPMLTSDPTDTAFLREYCYIRHEQSEHSESETPIDQKEPL